MRQIFLDCQRIPNNKFEGLSIDFTFIADQKGLISAGNPFEDSDILAVKNEVDRKQLSGDILVISGYPCFLISAVALQLWANYKVIAIYDPLNTSALIVMSEDSNLLGCRIPDKLFFTSTLVRGSLQNFHR